MKPLLKKTLLGAGGVSLFTVAFVAFAAMSGAPRHELPLIGALFEPPPPEANPGDVADPGSDETAKAPQARKDQELIQANTSALGAFVLPSPYTVPELSKLEAEMKSAQRQVGTRLTRIAERERELDEEERRLSEHRAQLEAFRNQLETYELELRGREEELQRDGEVAREREEQSWTEIATFFEAGEPKKLVTKLTEFAPDEAAKILRSLDPEQASGLINALPTESYRAYLDAYRASSTGSAKAP